MFDFHLDPKNISKITPSDTTIEIVSLKLPIHTGSIIVLNSSKYFIKSRWEVEIDKLEFPNLICDKAIKSPFEYFYHKHIFKELAQNRTELIDSIEFTPPLGIFGAILIPIIKNEFKNMFEFRQETTKKILES